MEIDILEDFNPDDVKLPPKKFQPTLKNNALSKKKKIDDTSVSVKTEKLDSVENTKAESIVKVKMEKLEPVELMNVDEDDSKMSVEDGGMLFNVVEERLESKDVGMEEMDVKEDKVIREMDVYNCPPPADAKFYVVQYPLRPFWHPYVFDECVKEIRFKPESTRKHFEFEFDILNDRASYNQRESHSRKQTLSSKHLPLEGTSTTKLPSKVNHAIGVLEGNKIYICSVNDVVQMRPTIKFDEDVLDMVIEENVSGSGTKKLKDVTGKLPVTSSKDQDKTMSSNTQNVVQEEPWIPLKYRIHNETSENCLEKPMAANQSETPLIMRQHDYLNLYFPKKEKDNMAQKFQSLRSLPLEERLKKWLREGDSKAFRFSILKYLAPEASDDDVIKVLEEYAVVVQGLWVPKTSTLSLDYKDSTSEAKVCKALARDFVILKFSKNLKFTHSELEAFKTTMRSSLYEALNELGVNSEVLKRWKMKEPADPSFEKLYPFVAARQKQVLEAHAPKILSGVKQFLKKEGKLRNARFTVEKQEALSKALVVLFKDRGVHSWETICRGLRDMAVSASSIQNIVDKNWMVIAASCVNSQDELKGFIREFATIIHSSYYVSKSSLTSSELNPLRNVVIQLLQCQQPNEKLKKAQVLKSVELLLEKEVSDNDFLKVMSELCDSSSGGWMLKRPH